MSVEQTDQLIQLILNSVLMVVACMVILGALLVRHTATCNRWRAMSQEYFHLLGNAVMLRGDRLLHLKAQLLQFRKHYSLTHISVLLVYYALLLLVSSTLLLAIRTLVDWQGLITLSLFCFMGGTGILLAGTMLALLDFHLSRRSLLEEMNWILGLGENQPSSPKAAPRSLPSVRRSLPKPRLLPHLQRRTGSG